MNTRKRLVAGFTAAILMAGGLALAAAAPASAHTPDVNSDCSSLTVKLTQYEGSNTSKPNNVTVTIDGVEEDDVDFGQSFEKTYGFDNKYEAHEYVVVVDADGRDYDRTFSGTSVPCEAPPLEKNATAELTVTSPTCEVPAELVLGETNYATWGAPSATDGPASYSVTATATKGHAFESGEETQVFTGELAGVLDPNEAPCYVPPVIPDEPEPIVSSVDEETADCTTDTVTTVTTTTTTGWNYDEETNTWIEAEPVVTTSSVTRDATDQECPPVPVKPEPVVTSVDKEAVDCTTDTVTTVTTTTTTDWVYNDETNTWVEGEPVVTTASVTRDATDQECPPVPVKPEPVVTSVDKETVDCTTDTVTTVTTTTTTGWNYDEETNTWVEGEPVVTTASVTRDATDQECPPAVTPVTPTTPAATPVAPVTPVTASEKLASTGFDSGWMLPLAALLLAAGIVLPFARRLRHQ